MKSFQMTVWGVIALFGLILAGVIFGSFSHKSHVCHVDPAQIEKIRNQEITV